MLEYIVVINAPELLKLVLAAGADVHADDDYALQLASADGHVECVKVLLAAGADVHAGKDLALRGASRHGHVECVKVLLKAKGRMSDASASDAGADGSVLCE